MRVIRNFGKLFSKAFQGFMKDNVLKLAAALSYYTIFSLPPLLVIIIWLSGMFFGVEAARGEIYGQIQGFVGHDAAIQLQEMIKNVHRSRDNTFASTLGLITLLIGASGVFAEIQDSINHIWGLKPKPKKGFVKMLRNRLMSFSMIVSMGFLLLVSLVLNAILDIISGKLQTHMELLPIWFYYIINIALMLTVITALFVIIFHTLPDGHVAWKDSFIGAVFTSVLFMIGKWAIGYYLANSNILTTYGAAGSVIVILIWVYYSAIILYFGAEFTKVYAYTFGSKIIPNSYTVHIEKMIIEQPEEISTEPIADVE